jgi:Holliday junction resolvase-like predicted endonuclease
MRFERLTLTSGTTSVSMPFHPRLTVIAGVGQLERDSISSELLGALSGAKRRSRLELVDDRGRRLVIERHDTDPGLDKVFDAATGVDVTKELRTSGGEVDILATNGLTLAEVKQRARITAADLNPGADAGLSRLARHDQAVLWAAAERVLQTEAVAKAEAATLSGRNDDVASIERIEQRHGACESAENRLSHLGRLGFRLALPAAAAAAITYVAADKRIAYALGGVIAAVLVLLGLLLVHVALLRRREHKALATVGADSYIVFHIRRMDELLAGQMNRQKLAEVAHARTAALAEWKHLAGGATVEWALANKDRVLTLQRRNATLAADVTGGGAEAAEMAQGVIARLADLRHACASGDSIPLLLDDPFTGSGTAAKQWLLELVGRSAGSPQCVLLTEDPEVASWARMEAIGGQLAVIEATPVDITPEVSASVVDAALDAEILSSYEVG